MSALDDLRTIVTFSMTSAEFQEGVKAGTEDSVRAALALALGISSKDVPDGYVTAFMPLGGPLSGGQSDASVNEEGNEVAQVLVNMAEAFAVPALSN